MTLLSSDTTSTSKGIVLKNAIWFMKKQHFFLVKKVDSSHYRSIPVARFDIRLVHLAALGSEECGLEDLFLRQHFFSDNPGYMGVCYLLFHEWWSTYASNPGQIHHSGNILIVVVKVQTFFKNKFRNWKSTRDLDITNYIVLSKRRSNSSASSRIKQVTSNNDNTCLAPMLQKTDQQESTSVHT